MILRGHLGGRYRCGRAFACPMVSAALIGLVATTPAQAGQVASKNAFPSLTVATVAGGIGGPALATKISLSPCQVTFHSGQLYVTEGTAVRRITTSDDHLANVAGVGVEGFAPDGTPALSAQLGNACGIAVDRSGNTVFSDTANNRIRVVAASSGTFYGQAMTAGDVYTIAGNGTGLYAGDGGPAVSAELGSPAGVLIDSAGNVLFAEQFDSRIRVIAASAGTFYGRAMTAGDIYTIAGNGTTGFAGDGAPATAAELGRPFGLAVDRAGNVVIADSGNSRIRVVATATATMYGQAMTAGDIYTVAGDGIPGYSGDGGPAASAMLRSPQAVAVDQAGNIVIADTFNSRVRVLAVKTGTFYGESMTAGDITTIAGTTTEGFNGDGGLAAKTDLFLPEGLAFDGGGNLLIADHLNGRVRVIAATTGRQYGMPMLADHIYTVAGGFTAIPVNGILASSAQLPGLMTVRTDPGGNLLISADGYTHVLFLPTSSGTFWGQSMLAGHIYKIAGNGNTGFSGDGGLATGAAMTPEGIALDRAGNLVLADLANRRVRVVAVRTGRFWGQDMQADHVYTIAGNGGSVISGLGGLATKASLQGPIGLAVDSAGNVIVSDVFGGRVLVVAARTGTFYGRAMQAQHIYELAGNGRRSFSGDGGPARDASLDGPDSLAIDSSGNVLIADTSNFRIRAVAAATGTFYGQAMTAGNIYTIAGNGSSIDGTGGVPAIQTGVDPGGIALDAAGNIIFSAEIDNRIMIIADSTGSFYGQNLTAGDIYTLAGTGAGGFSGDGGPAGAAQFNRPSDATVTPSGTIIIGDWRRIRTLS